MTDYHVKPVLSARVPRETLVWAQQEAGRRGLAFGDFVAAALDAVRQRTAEGPSSEQALIAALRLAVPQDYEVDDEYTVDAVRMMDVHALLYADEL